MTILGDPRGGQLTLTGSIWWPASSLWDLVDPWPYPAQPFLGRGFQHSPPPSSFLNSSVSESSFFILGDSLRIK